MRLKVRGGRCGTRPRLWIKIGGCNPGTGYLEFAICYNQLETESTVYPLSGSYVTAIRVLDGFQSFIDQGFLHQFIDSVNGWWDGHLDGTGGSPEIWIEGMGEKIGLLFRWRIEPEACDYVSEC